MHYTQRGAMHEGSKAFLAGRPITDNPYAARSKSHGSFEAGWREAERKPPMVCGYCRAEVRGGHAEMREHVNQRHGGG